jgi:hypothetical protein
LLAAGSATIALQPAHEGDVETGRDTTQTTTVAPVGSPSVIVTAGPDGIHEIFDGSERVVTKQAMAMALELDDGSVVAQRHSGDGRAAESSFTNAETMPLLFATDGTETSLLDGVALDGGVILHDFAVVEGRRLLLYGTEDRYARSFVEHLFTLDVDTNEVTPVGEVGGLSGPGSRLTMASTGLIVGTNYTLAAEHGLVALAVPGSPAAAKPLPQEADFWKGSRSIDSVYATGFAVDPDGTTLYWFLPKDTPMNDHGGGTLMSAPLDNPTQATEVALPSEFDNAWVYELEIDPGDRGLVVNKGSRFAYTQAPRLIRNGSSTTLPGRVATTGPTG